MEDFERSNAVTMKQFRKRGLGKYHHRKHELPLSGEMIESSLREFHDNLNAKKHLEALLWRCARDVDTELKESGFDTIHNETKDKIQSLHLEISKLENGIGEKKISKKHSRNRALL